MNTKCSLLFLLCATQFGIHASEAPRPTPTIDFSSRTMVQLIEYARSNNLEALTPRSNQSYVDRYNALANQRLNDLRAQLAEMMPQGQLIIIIPAAADMPNSGHEGVHGPNCICHLLDQFMSRQGAESDADHEDMTTEEATHNEEPTAEELNRRMKDMNFNKKQ